MLKKLAIDISDFPTMRRENYVYVDKTRHVYDLISQGKLYFLARPRRFGKTLLISTLKELFLGNKELFSDLWIAKNTEYEWGEHPVLSFNFSGMNHSSTQLLEQELIWAVQRHAQGRDIDVSGAPTLQAKLTLLVESLAQRQKVVILIDEYDHPLVSHLEDNQLINANKELLASFYATIKALSEHMRFVFITGVTKFSKTSLFSGMNNLIDISMKPQASTLLGYTQEEISQNYDEHVTHFAREKNREKASVCTEMMEWYNGYQFSETPIRVYNPFSVQYYLTFLKRANYWFASGTPTFLIHFLKKHQTSLDTISQLFLSEVHLISFDMIDQIPLATLLFQTGYLTIDRYDESLEVFHLRFPNKEVEQSLTTNIVGVLAQTQPEHVKSALISMLQALDANSVEKFSTILQGLFANIPYQLHIPLERYYHSLVQFLANLIGLDATSEVSTSNGRIDLEIVRPARIYIFEFKFESTASAGVDQIVKRRYAEKYALQDKPVTCVGMSFRFKDKKLVIEWEVG